MRVMKTVYKICAKRCYLYIVLVYRIQHYTVYLCSKIKNRACSKSTHVRSPILVSVSLGPPSMLGVTSEYHTVIALEHWWVSAQIKITKLGFICQHQGSFNYTIKASKEYYLFRKHHTKDA